MMTNKEVGIAGEELAANYLMKQGYRLLHRNWRLKGGCEIDIVAFKDNALHFVEVKTRTTTFVDPARAVNTEKLRHIGRASLQYKHFYHYTFDTHIDVIAIVYRSDTEYDLHWIPDVHQQLC